MTAPTLENLRFAESLGEARALLKIAPRISRNQKRKLPFPELARALRQARQAGRGLRSSLHAILDGPDDEQTDEVLQQALLLASSALEIMRPLVDATKAVEQGRLAGLAKDWPRNAVRDLAILLEDIEDIQASIAMGLNAEFRSKLEQARNAAQQERTS